MLARARINTAGRASCSRTRTLPRCSICHQSQKTSRFPSLSKEISPISKEESRPVPAEQIDKNLDGITLKSSGLTSSFVAKITSPQFDSPARSPSPRAKETPKKNNLQVSMSGLMSPLDEKLKRNAGHTPMAFSGDTSISAEVSTGIPTPHTRKPTRSGTDSEASLNAAGREFRILFQLHRGQSD